jgi:hypothetical protein
VDATTRTVPPLEACVLRTGPVGVFPADPPGVCERLGLTDWTVRVERGSWGADRPCTQASIDQGARLVVLSGEEDRSRYLQRDG